MTRLTNKDWIIIAEALAAITAGEITDDMTDYTVDDFEETHRRVAERLREGPIAQG